MKPVLAILGTLLVSALALAADIDELVKKLSDKDVEVRRAAARELSNAGSEAKPALGALTRRLSDPDLYVRRFAAQAIGSIGSEAQSAIPYLQTVLSNRREEKEVQEAAVVALGNLGKGGVEILVAVMKDRNREGDVRRKAVESLGKIGTDARAAIPALVEVLQGKDRGAPKAKGSNPPADLGIELCNALGNVATAKDNAAVKALEGMAGMRIRDRALMRAVNDALKKIKERTS
jgi:HEAT repeat protein